MKTVGSRESGFLAGILASGGGEAASADSAAACCCELDGDLTGGAGGAVLGRTVDWYCGPRALADDILFGRTGTLEESAGLIKGGTGLGVETGSGLDVSLTAGLLPLELWKQTKKSKGNSRKVRRSKKKKIK